MLFAGGHAERFSLTDKRGILRKQLKASSRENLNYMELAQSKLKDFIPKYYGEVHENGKTFILIENLLADFDMAKTNIIDIKISYIKKPPLCYKYPNNYRIVGCVINGKEIRLNKRDDFYSTLHYIDNHIKEFKHHISGILKELEKMMSIITNEDLLYSTSLLIAVTNDKFFVKLIDFTDYNSKEYRKRPDVDIKRFDIEMGLKNIYQQYQYLEYTYRDSSSQVL